jgi:protein TonB
MKRDFDLRRVSAAAAFGGYLPEYVVLTSCYPEGGSRSEAISAAASASALTSAPLAGYSRYCDSPVSWSERLIGVAATSVIFGLVMAAALVTWQTVQQPARPVSRPLTVVELSQLAAPPTPKKDVAQGPERVERQADEPKPVSEVEPQPLIQLPAPSVATSPPSEPVERVDPGPPVPETTAPKSIAAPSATRVSSDAKARWEALLLAHLERFRRYPARARATREQGVAYIRFTMDRAGKVLSSSIARKSGSVTLDLGALDTLRRAQPLPAIPPDMPDIVELTIPVEFYLN